jgi:hypothetical protein
MGRTKPILKFLLLITVIAGVAACESYDLEVQNKTEEILDIYVDDFYEGAAAPDNYLLIRGLSKGEHFIEAFDIDEYRVVKDYIYVDGDSKLVIHESYYRFY